VRIETGREIVIPPSVAERTGMTQAWRVTAVVKREARTPMPRELRQDLRVRGRLVDILV